MAQLNLKVDEERLQKLRGYAARRRTPISWLLKDYIDYLLAGGRPVSEPTFDVPSSEAMAALAEKGGSLDWLAEEPDIYTWEDGEPV